MPACPNCGKFIVELNYFEKQWHEYTMSVITTGKKWIVGLDDTGDTSETQDAVEIWCPECDTLLFTDHDEAGKFLASCEEKKLRKKCEKCAGKFKCWTNE